MRRHHASVARAHAQAQVRCPRSLYPSAGGATQAARDGVKVALQQERPSIRVRCPNPACVVAPCVRRAAEICARVRAVWALMHAAMARGCRTLVRSTLEAIYEERGMVSARRLIPGPRLCLHPLSAQRLWL